ncbi:MAG: hypothetical protein ACJ76S_04000 [Solirubrobacteraceae bacterium]|jgi:hypothetical protein
MPFESLRDIVRARATSGEPLTAIEQDVIEPSGLDEEHKAALWLYGWASQVRRDGHPALAPVR